MTRRLNKKEMWIFATGQLGWSLLGGIINTWLVTFYLPTQEDIANGAIPYLVPGLIIGGILTLLGLITFICRIFDAVSDPLIASLQIEAIISEEEEFRLCNILQFHSQY